MKLISFAVPCYNSAEYMNKCIESLLKGGEDVEILIVNDGSTKDNTKEIADQYAEKYPTIVKAIHKENGGHGDAVNFGIKNATGKYFKVVDSDDWVDEQSLYKLISAVRSFDGKEEVPDAFLTNYVYEYTFNNTERVVEYKNLPKEKLFDFEETKAFEVGQFIAMHSVMYRTELLKEIGLELPKHTFYVDNIFVYLPLPYVKKFYYINIDFYRYFIGRPDQSINEKVIMSRIDQHILVTKKLLEKHNINDFQKERPKLYKYMQSFLLIMMVVNSIYLIKLGTKEDLKKKKELWEYFKEKDPVTCKRIRRRFTGMVASDNRFVCWLCKKIYTIVRKKYKFN
ncbi:MAG: glycosyltransferase family 2 protein [Clostridia bacterium]|nr:glycosyltransferase family 2 protein [Clostridia bacterium]